MNEVLRFAKKMIDLLHTYWLINIAPKLSEIKTTKMLTTGSFPHSFCLHCARGVFANLIARHLAFSLVFTNAHSLSFSVADSTGNLLKTNTFNEFSLLLSRHCLPCEPSVLLFMISSFVKSKGRRFTAHLCLFTSFWSASRTRWTFRGVTHVRMTSSATGASTALSTVLLELTVLARVAGVGAAGVSTEKLSSTSALKLSKVSTSIVDRSWRGGTLADKLTDNGSVFIGLGNCEKKKKRAD